MCTLRPHQSIHGGPPEYQVRPYPGDLSQASARSSARAQSHDCPSEPACKSKAPAGSAPRWGLLDAIA
eukprot:921758-Alexandrium_andersonii.AAC.1